MALSLTKMPALAKVLCLPWLLGQCNNIKNSNCFFLRLLSQFAFEEQNDCIILLFIVYMIDINSSEITSLAHWQSLMALSLTKMPATAKICVYLGSLASVTTNISNHNCLFLRLLSQFAFEEQNDCIILLFIVYTIDVNTSEITSLAYWQSLVALILTKMPAAAKVLCLPWLLGQHNNKYKQFKLFLYQASVLVCI